ncbi:hypothetical protein, partial [Salmonella enterica]|uniref:hypothetical protein n=1 Tax=Salmonella enterica TaxID=28901 RepID=UPI00398C527C
AQNEKSPMPQIIPPLVSPVRESQNLSIIISKKRRIDSLSHYYLHTAAPLLLFLCADALKKPPVFILAKLSSVSHVARLHMVIFVPV